jgi:hypothetical protein
MRGHHYHEVSDHGWVEEEEKTKLRPLDYFSVLCCLFLGSVLPPYVTLSGFHPSGCNNNFSPVRLYSPNLC